MIGAVGTSVLKDHGLVVEVVLCTYAVRNALRPMVGNHCAMDDLDVLDVIDVVVVVHGQIEIFNMHFAIGPSNPMP